MTYPDTAGFQSHSITSREAADKLDATQMREIAFKLVSDNTWRGRTADEVNAELEEKYGKDRVHIAPRFRELEMDGKLIKTAQTRKTRYNRNASVYVTPAYFTDDMGRAGVKPEKPKDIMRLEIEHARMKAAMLEAIELLDNGYDPDAYTACDNAHEVLKKGLGQ